MQENLNSNDLNIVQADEHDIIISKGKEPVEENNETIHGYDVFGNTLYGKVDGSFDISATNDKMSAILSCEPSFGNGKPVSSKDVIKQIKELGINTGINSKAIDDLIKTVESKKEA